ncbi:hypothetical protein D3C72_2590810 [compost metagenome]
MVAMVRATASISAFTKLSVTGSLARLWAWAAGQGRGLQARPTSSASAVSVRPAAGARGVPVRSGVAR